MKTLVFIFLFLASITANALEVMASGFGKDYNEALTNAKIVALDKVNGAWVNGDSFVRNGMFSEKITQYNGGVIKSYEVLKNDNTFVIIKADVIPRTDNTVSKNTLAVPNVKQRLEGQQSEYNSRMNAIKIVDDRSRALAFSDSVINYDNRGSETVVEIEGTLSYQPMWLNQFKELQQMTGGFNLQSFYRPAYVKVIGYDGHEVVLTETVKLYDELYNLYRTPSTGVVVNPNGKQDITFWFKTNTDTLKKIDRYEVVVL